MSAARWQEITLRGWLYTCANREIAFPIFDGTGTIPGRRIAETAIGVCAVAWPDEGVSVIVTGRIPLISARGRFEIQITAIEVVQTSPDDTPYPSTGKKHGRGLPAGSQHLWIRTPRQSDSAYPRPGVRAP